tara:strand:- start:313 stop:537 length:225 start_codon:yes stop_codon:yes gene_type:complete
MNFHAFNKFVLKKYYYWFLFSLIVNAYFYSVLAYMQELDTLYNEKQPKKRAIIGNGYRRKIIVDRIEDKERYES